MSAPAPLPARRRSAGTFEQQRRHARLRLLASDDFVEKHMVCVPRVCESAEAQQEQEEDACEESDDGAFYKPAPRDRSRSRAALRGSTDASPPPAAPAASAAPVAPSARHSPLRAGWSAQMRDMIECALEGLEAPSALMELVECEPPALPSATVSDARLYCVCRRPALDDGQEMHVQCELCDDWFHPECCGLDRAFARELPAFFCDACCSASLQRVRALQTPCPVFVKPPPELPFSACAAAPDEEPAPQDEDLWRQKLTFAAQSAMLWDPASLPCSPFSPSADLLCL